MNLLNGYDFYDKFHFYIKKISCISINPRLRNDFASRKYKKNRNIYYNIKLSKQTNN